MMTGPHGWLVTRAMHEKDIHKRYIGVDASAGNLLRPAMYGAYHHISVVGKRDAPEDMVYDVTGALCENNDKFAIDRKLPRIDMGDLLLIHDAGAHAFGWGISIMAACVRQRCCIGWTAVSADPPCGDGGGLFCDDGLVPTRAIICHKPVKHSAAHVCDIVNLQPKAHNLIN